MSSKYEVSHKMSKLRAQDSMVMDEEVSVERTLGLLRKLIVKIEEQLDTANVKGSVADYIKLLQLQRELEEKRVRRIEVKWVDTD